MTSLVAIPTAIRTTRENSRCPYRYRIATRSMTPIRLIRSLFARMSLFLGYAPSCDRELAALSDCETDASGFVHVRSPTLIPIFTRAPVRGISVALRHLVFCFATRPGGFRHLPKQIRSNGTERRVDFFSVPSGKADLRHLGAGPTPAASPCVSRANRELKMENKPCI